MSTFLFGGKLVLEVDPPCASLYHLLHQFKHVERPAKTRFSICNNRNKPVDASLALRMLDLVCPLKSLVEPPNKLGNTVRRVKAQVRIRFPCKICISGNLPATQIDGA